MDLTIRPLIEDDAEPMRLLRLDALARDPDGFGSTLEMESRLPLSHYQTQIQVNRIVGAFADRLVGMAGLALNENPKTRHKGILWGVYVQPEFREQGVAQRMLEEQIRWARDEQGLEKLNLFVVTSSETAIRLYQLLGFHIFGTEERALKYGDRFFDQYLMTKHLR